METDIQTSNNTDVEEKTKKKRSKAANMIIDFVCGIAVGAGAIMPGFSGGVLCVVLGMYPLVMELFSHPIRAAKKNWKAYILIGIGWAIGFFAVSNLIKFMFARFEVYTTWTFIGLIFGNLPSLYKEAGKKGRSMSSFVSMGIAFVVMFAMLLTVALLPSANITPNLGWYLFSGVMWGIYEAFNAGLAGFKLEVVIPWVIGMLVTAAALARLIEAIFKKYHSQAFHAVIGIVVSSTLMIFTIFAPYTWVNVLISVLCVVGGFIAAYFLSNFKVEAQE